MNQQNSSVDIINGNMCDEKKSPVIVIDGVFFQLNTTGIARVWYSLLKEWSQSGFSRNIILLDRGKTAPQIPNIRYKNIRRYSYEETGLDAQILQAICDEVEADLFISTYYTSPISTPSVLMVYDMIPEVLEFDLEKPMWKEKHYGILQACRYITISQNTANDLIKFFPMIPSELVTVAHCGVDRDFTPANFDQIINFRTKYGIQQPYFLLVGLRTSLYAYKNAILLFKALTQWAEREKVSVVCVGGEPTLEPELSELISDTPIYILQLDESELRSAYSGAIALVYPSRYEGFGLPIVEAMACGCPVITCRNSSIPEIAEEAVIYVDEYQVKDMVNALSKVQISEIRQSLIERGFEQVKKYSWTKMADITATTLIDSINKSSCQKDPKQSLIWLQLRQMQTKFQTLSSQSQESLKQLEFQLKQTQQTLEKTQTNLEAMESSKRGNFQSALLQFKELFLPLGALITGLNSLIIYNSPYTRQLLVRKISWLSEFQDNLFFTSGVNLLSIALILGFVGYLGLVQAKILRVLRILLIIGGLIFLVDSLLTLPTFSLL